MSHPIAHTAIPLFTHMFIFYLLYRFIYDLLVLTYAYDLNILQFSDIR
jgi:hypothetical protein